MGIAALNLRRWLWQKREEAIETRRGPTRKKLC
jgi:hypothetical protein